MNHAIVLGSDNVTILVEPPSSTEADDVTADLEEWPYLRTEGEWIDCHGRRAPRQADLETLAFGLGLPPLTAGPHRPAAWGSTAGAAARLAAIAPLFQPEDWKYAFARGREWRSRVRGRWT